VLQWETARRRDGRRTTGLSTRLGLTVADPHELAEENDCVRYVYQRLPPSARVVFRALMGPDDAMWQAVHSRARSKRWLRKITIPVIAQAVGMSHREVRAALRDIRSELYRLRELT
jgi:hypothetical protein